MDRLAETLAKNQRQASEKSQSLLKSARLKSALTDARPSARNCAQHGLSLIRDAETKFDESGHFLSKQKGSVKTKGRRWQRRPEFPLIKVHADPACN